MSKFATHYSSMSKFATYWGKAVSNQEVLNEKHRSLFIEPPKLGDILSNPGRDGAVVFDGVTWRKLDLAAMQKDAINTLYV